MRSETANEVPHVVSYVLESAHKDGLPLESAKIKLCPMKERGDK